MKNFDDAVLRGIDAEKRRIQQETDVEQHRADIEKAWNKASAIQEADAIQPEAFINPYDEAMVRADLAYVAHREAQFEKEGIGESEKLATIFEAVVAEGIDLHDWFGESATTITPSRYDDIKNGVDRIVEFQEGESSASHLALAIDITFNATLENKFGTNKIEVIIDDINRGHLTEIKYFHSEHLGLHGKLSNVPRVIIGAERRKVQELSELWLANNKEALAKHPAQFQILKEILVQLIYFEQYAEQKGQGKLARTYRRARGIVEAIAQEKGGLPEGKFEGDRVYQAIMEYVGRREDKNAQTSI